MLVFPNCKINLGLQVRRKRPDGFHDLETVFYPVPVQDALELVQAEGKGNIEFTSSGIPVTAAPEDNICVKAYRLLQQGFPDLPSVRMHLHKTIPSGAGLGGGSADGAYALMLLNEQFRLGLAAGKLVQVALHLGSDCPFFIYNTPSFAEGRGERLQPLTLDLSGYRLLLAHPGIHVPTPAAFRGVTPNDERPSLRDVATLPVTQWRDALQNDFETSVFAQHPEIAQLKETMYRLGAVYASMSGSGSAVYGLFPKDAEMPPLSFPAHYFVRTVALS